MKNKYKVGGKVEISGEWYEIEEVDERNSFSQTTMPVKIMLDNGDFDWPEECYIADYVPPVSKEWITEEMVAQAFNSGAAIRAALNIMLNDKYGEPPHEKN